MVDIGRRQMIASLGSFGAMALAGFPAKSSSSEDSLVVALKDGRVAGTREANGTRVWRGIPFARPPIGAARGRAPQPVEPWSTVKNTTAFGSPAVQQALGPFPAPTTGTEDCLYLNVWAPEQPSDKPRPVLVWIHGGGFVFGAASEPIYHGDGYAAWGDLIFVSFNYRLSGFGFLATTLDSGSANLALLDQIAALRWIRDNIAAFGGDPTAVTIMGESAGGMSVGCLLGTPAARGLFARAIVQSGGARPVYPVGEARQVTALVLAEAGLQPGDDEKLMKLPADELQRLFSAVAAKSDTALLGGEPFHPAIDGAVLQKHPLRTLATVPTLVGHCENEALTFSSMAALLEGLPAKVHALAGEKLWAGLTEAYEQNARPQRDPSLDLFSDCFTGVPSLRLSDELTKVGAPVWNYRFDYAKASPIGAAHGTDVAFTFGKAQGAPFPVEWTAEAQALSQLMTDSIIAFVRTGNPQTSALPEWPKHDPSQLAYMGFDVQPAIGFDYVGAERRAAWASVPIEAV